MRNRRSLLMTASGVVGLLASALCTPPATAQSSISEGICQMWENVMKGQTIPFRQQGIPIGAAEGAYDSEDDVRTRIFLKQTVRMIYENPTKGAKFVNSGAFRKQCIKIHRGY